MTKTNASLRAAVFSFAFTICTTSVYGQDNIKVQPDPAVKEAVEIQEGGSPELIRQTREQLEEYKRAEQYDPKIKCYTKSVSLPLSNLKLGFEVAVNSDYITTLTFLDQNGNPYPTRLSRAGDAESFFVCSGSSSSCEAGEDELDLAHILTLSTNKLAGRSNLKVLFKGLHRAVHIPLVVKRNYCHDEVTISLPNINPDFEMPEPVLSNYESIVPQVDDLLARGLLDNLAYELLSPATPVTVNPVSMTDKKLPINDLRAVYNDGFTYIKTRLLLPQPSPNAITEGLMGQRVYRFKGKPHDIRGTYPSGRVVILKIKYPDSLAAYRTF